MTTPLSPASLAPAYGLFHKDRLVRVYAWMFKGEAIDEEAYLERIKARWRVPSTSVRQITLLEWFDYQTRKEMKLLKGSPREAQFRESNSFPRWAQQKGWESQEQFEFKMWRKHWNF
ncbi:hypothetical protein [Catalinimonas alkaloidigena]|nr:hypothetical protein [Catalinimonas alkaloidigena]